MRTVIITVSNNLVTDHRVAKMTGYLKSRGYKVLVWGRKWPAKNYEQEVNVRRFNLWFNKGPLFYLNLNCRLFFALLTQRADFFLAVDLDTLPACRLAGLFRRTPVVFDSHEYFPEVPELQHRPLIKSIWLTIQDWLVPGIYAGITVSKGLVNLYKERYQLDFKLVRNIPSVAKHFIPIRKVNNRPVVYYQGALNVGRGLEEAIRAMAFLPGYQLLIVGRGDLEHDLKQLTDNLKLNAQVRFVGAVPFYELPKYAAQAHVGLCLLQNLGLNYYHSLPNRLFDYPMLGLPILASDFPDIHDFIEQYETGLLTSSMVPSELAAIIRRICEDDKLRERIGEKMMVASSMLSWENEVKQLNTIFH
ncbi:glycosyltransferase [Geofilum sp. OHC36d9]|uniref:glycosyltransferase n=1 Tax=Geofilum sp. OHC36d9 TaxID=3458413 RepID=UPI004033CB05